MKRSLLPLLTWVTCLLSPGTAVYAQQPDTDNPYLTRGPFDTLWEEVYTLELKLQPKEARKVVTQIYAKARLRKLNGERIKAALFEAKFISLLDEDGQWEVIDHLREEIENAKSPERQILNSYLTLLYERYFDRNRWQILDRTPVEETASARDFRFWDASAFQREMKKTALLAVEDPATLQAIPVDAYRNLIDLGGKDIEFMPTLYDLLAHRSLNHLLNSTYAPDFGDGAPPFLTPDYFGPADVFLKAELPEGETSSLAEAFRIYRELTRFHRKESEGKVLGTKNLNRIDLAFDRFRGENKDELLLQGLDASVEAAATPEEKAVYLLRKAVVYVRQAAQYDFKKGPAYRFHYHKADDLADEVLSLTEDEYLHNRALNLKDLLHRPTLAIQSESFIHPGRESLFKVEYRNIDSLYYSVFRVPHDLEPRLSEKDDRIFRQEPVQNWGVRLAESGDLQEHSAEFVLPALEKGTYLLVAHPCSRPMPTDFYSYKKIQVTSLVLLKNQIEPGKVEMQVRDRWNGGTKPGASIRIETWREKDSKTVKADPSGTWSAPLRDRFMYNPQITVNWEKDTLFVSDNLYTRDRLNPENDRQLSLYVMTDRGIYRPGQTMYFKLIGALKDGDRYGLPEGAEVSLKLSNPNGELVRELRLTLNDWGSAQGEILLPETGLTGRYGLRAQFDSWKGASRRTLQDASNAYSSVQVEAYKRPTFFVEFPPEENTPSLWDSLRVQGVAETYSGAWVTGAGVTYRVTRGVERPHWWYRWYGYGDSNSGLTEIATGETQTDAEGAFLVPFTAEAPAGEEDAQSIYVFTIHAEVTDINGETHSMEKTIRLGKTRLQARMKIPEALSTRDRDVHIQLQTSNLNGDFVPASGTLEIYALQGPGHAKRDRPWEEAEFPALDSLAFAERFPHEYQEHKEANRTEWPRGDRRWNARFDTGEETSYPLGSLRKWPAGVYLVLLSTADSDGNPVTAREIVTIENPKAKTLVVKESLWAGLDQKTYTPGETASLRIGSSLENLSVEVLVEKEQQIVQRRTLLLRNSIEEIEIPVTEKDRGGFVIWVQGVGQNEHLLRQMFVTVPHRDTELKIKTLTFRDKILPGNKESWSFEWRDPDGKSAKAEVLASMYDASLDAIESFGWFFDPVSKPRYTPVTRLGTRSFGQGRWRLSNLNWPITSYNNPDYPDWTNFGLFGGRYWQYNQYLRQLRENIRLDAQYEIASSYDPKVPKGIISGVLLDAEGNPLPGATIVVKGTSLGTTTDFDGKFSIEAPTGSTLEIAYIGYKGVEYHVQRDNSLVVSMEEDSSQLDEVVVLGYGVSEDRSLTASVRTVREEEFAEEDVMFMAKASNLAAADFGSGAPGAAPTPPAPDSTAVDLSSIEARTNLKETAFFMPQLRTDEEGRVRIEFESPEALTRWNVWLLAHDRELNTSFTQLETVTQKELMVVPNVPRFLREGDRIVLQAKITNLSGEDQQGQAQLEFTDPATGESLDLKLSLQNAVQDFAVGNGGNASLSWEIHVPEGLQSVQYRIVAGTGSYSDGQQDLLPVLTNRTLVTETLPLWVNGKESRSFELGKLLTQDSPTLSHHQYVVEVTGNPVWYAVQSLPYLMEYPYECAEQTFSRLYANSLGAFIVRSYPPIRATWKQWEEDGSLVSPLEQNPELKALVIEETPWLRDAQSETEQMQRMSRLFDDKQMNREFQKAINQLEDMQFSDGGFPWFKGSRYPSRYITQHIVAGFGHLFALGADQEVFELKGGKVDRMLEDALGFLDEAMAEDYAKLLEKADEMEKAAKTPALGKRARTRFLSKRHLHRGLVHHLYARSFFPEREVDDAARYYHEQLVKYWSDFNLQTWAMSALYLHRSGEEEEARKILKAIDQLSVENEETGIFWKENVAGWYWYQAPVETQSILIELYDELLPDGADKSARLGGMRTWLLKQKQTQAWRTTKATTEAVYALLRGGKKVLEPGQVAVTLGDRPIAEWNPETSRQEAGTGYQKFAFQGEAVKPEMARVQLTKTNEGPTWGAAYWQYFEDLDKVESAETPLRLRKQLFRRDFGPKGEVLSPIKAEDPLKVGDLVRVRIELESDRRMEFLHLKDHRASAFEPVEVISGYKYQEGLWYYQSMRDASANFFIEDLEKGVYVFEYDLRVSQEGSFSNGHAQIQSMYAPEFSSHSEGLRVEVVGSR